MLIRSIIAREKLDERFSASAVFQRKIERINTVARHVLLKSRICFLHNSKLVKNVDELQIQSTKSKSEIRVVMF